MKIICQACGAHYTIVDDKVKGKRLKIRCKSCGTAIVVNASALDAQGAVESSPESSEAPLDWAPESQDGPDLWSVNLNDTDSSKMTAAEIATAFRAGTLPKDTFVWKTGMADWLPISQCTELKAVLEGSAGADARSQARSRASLIEGHAADTSDLFAKVSVAGSEEEEAGRTRSPQTGPAGGDARPTGARNENSVLFSLDALKAGFTAPSAKSEPPPQALAGDPFGMGGGRTAGPRGTMLSLVDSDALLTAPAREAPRAVIHAAPPIAASSASAAGPRKWWMIAIIAGGLAASGLGLGAGLLLHSKPPAVPAMSSPGESEVSPKTTPPKETSDNPKPPEPLNQPVGLGSTPPVASEVPDESGKVQPPNSEVSSKTRLSELAKRRLERKDKERERDKPTHEVAGSVEAPPFSKAAAISVLTAAATDASACKKPGGPTGTGKVQVTFAPSGRITSATVPEPPFAGTSVGGCVAAVFRKAKVPAFSGSPMTVAKGFTIGR